MYCVSIFPILIVFTILFKLGGNIEHLSNGEADLSELNKAVSDPGKEAAKKKVPLVKIIFNKEMQDAAIDALLNERFVMGESVYKFEEEFARYCGVDYAVSTSSGTSALHLVLVALGVNSRHRVVTSPASFVATANAVIHAGATPVFADVELKTGNLDFDKFRHRITSETKAVIPVSFTAILRIWMLLWR